MVSGVKYQDKEALFKKTQQRSVEAEVRLAAHNSRLEAGVIRAELEAFGERLHRWAHSEEGRIECLEIEERAWMENLKAQVGDKSVTEILFPEEDALIDNE